MIGFFAVESEVSGDDLRRAGEVLETRCLNLRKRKGGLARLSRPGDSSQIVLVISENRDGFHPNFLGIIEGAEEEVEIVALGEDPFDERGEHRQGPASDKEMRLHPQSEACLQGQRHRGSESRHTLAGPLDKLDFNIKTHHQPGIRALWCVLHGREYRRVRRLEGRRFRGELCPPGTPGWRHRPC